MSAQSSLPSDSDRISESLKEKFWPILLLFLAGMVTGILILKIGSGEPGRSAHFVRTQRFLIWQFLLSLQIGLYFILPFPLYGALKKLREYSKGRKPDLAIGTVIFFIFVIFPYLLQECLKFPRIVQPLSYHHIRIYILYAMGLASFGLPSFWGLNLIFIAVRREFSILSARKNYVHIYRELQRHLNLFLSILGIMVGLLTLATGALRAALIGYDVPVGEFPAVLVVGYGLYYTALIALIYVPAFLALRKAGMDICKKYLPAPHPNDDSWTDWSQKRKILEETLQLNIGIQQRLQSNIYILAPLLSGIASLVFD